MITADTHVFVLGAADPEMSAIEDVLNAYGLTVLDALDTQLNRVRPSNAYRALPPDPVFVAGRQLVRVECAWPGSDDALVCDHHFPGDPGYGRNPAEYWEASSLGQVYELLGAEVVTRWRLRLVAAADHCLGAAYRGECPGVEVEALAYWRAASRAAFQRRSVDAVLADVEAARMRLQTASKRMVGFELVADLGSVSPPEAPEAACRYGIPFTAMLLERDGRCKVVLQAAAPATVREWMQTCGLVDLYGDPERGFAGGYLP